MASIINATTTNGVAITPDNSGSLQLATNNGTTAVTIDTSQNVGVGTSSPTTQRLHISAASVSGPTNNPAGIRITDTGTSEDIQLVNRSGNMLCNVATGNNYSWQINSSEVATIDSSGNVGIGTSSPNNVMTTYRGSGVNNYIQFTNQTTGTTSTDGCLIGVAADDTALRLRVLEAAPMIFTTSDTERMRIDSSGNFLLGATTQLGKFTGDVGTATFTSGNASAFFNWRATGNNGRPCIQVQSLTNNQDAAFRTAVYDGTTSYYWTHGQNISSAQTNYDFCYNTVGGTQTGSSATCYVRFTASGQVYNTSGTYGTISDIKLKENIVDATPKLDDLMQLKVRNFTLKADETKTKQLGFIAQEVQKVFPACVEKFDDIDPNTKEKTGETLTVKTAVMIPMLVKAIQEQQAMIETLKTELDTVKAELNTLKNPPVEGTE